MKKYEADIEQELETPMMIAYIHIIIMNKNGNDLLVRVKTSCRK